MLRQHPSVGFAFQKEVHYFDRVCKNKIDREQFSQKVRKTLLKGKEIFSPATRNYADYVANPEHSFTDEWYRGIFTAKPENKKRLERGEDLAFADASPSYMSMPVHGIRHMANLLPAAKPVLIVRDPVRRMISGLSMVQSRSVRHRNKSVIRQIRFLRRKQVPRGDYARAIPLFRKHFPEVHIIPFGRIRTAPEQVMREVENLFDLSPFSYSHSQANKNSHTGKVELNDAVKTTIERFCAPQYEYLRGEFGSDFLKEI